MSIFSRWRPAAILDLIWIILDHPQRVIVDRALFLKFGLDPIYSFGDMAISIFWRLGLKLPIPGHFGGVFWAYFPQNMGTIVLTSKGPSLRGNTSFEL